MHTRLRFGCPSVQMDLKALLRGKRSVVLALAVALSVHTGLTVLRGSSSQVPVPRPLTARFVKRAPRLSKPLELKKRPRPKRRRAERQMVSLKAKAHVGSSTRHAVPAQLAARLARPKPTVQRPVALPAPEVGAQVLSAIVSGTREPQNRIDTSLEMVDPEALDTGQYHAMVIQDPTDKRQVKGFFHLAVAYSPNIGRDQHTHTYISNMQAIPALVEALNKYTNIRTDISGTYTIDSKELFKTPIIFLIARTTRTFKVTPSEAENLGAYFRAGGFSFTEDAQWMLGGFCDVSLRQVLKDALATQKLTFGKDWDFEKLPNSHAVYHCFFDFDAPPAGDDGPYSRPDSRDRPYAPYKYLEGITIDGQLLTLYSMKALSTAWDWWRPGSWRSGNPIDNTRQLQFGVNIVVFALTQEGSITHRLMETVQ